MPLQQSGAGKEKAVPQTRLIRFPLLASQRCREVRGANGVGASPTPCALTRAPALLQRQSPPPPLLHVGSKPPRDRQQLTQTRWPQKPAVSLPPLPRRRSEILLWEPPLEPAPSSKRINCFEPGRSWFGPRDSRPFPKLAIVVYCPRMSDDPKRHPWLRYKGGSMTCGIILYETQG